MTQNEADLAELAGGFIHEIKNHLGTLGLNLQLLSEDFQDPQNQRERRAHDRVLRLQNECQRLVDLSNDFLRFARIRELELKPARLHDVVAEMVDYFGPIAKQGNIEIQCYMPADLPSVLLDRDTFKQAMLNLLLNAQQAMPDGGSLTIQVAEEPGGVRLNLIDTGKGMNAEVLGRVFKPFFSTRPGGTGLGLPTSKRIIEAHHGTIEVESEPGQGTRFTLHLRAGDSSDDGA